VCSLNTTSKKQKLIQFCISLFYFSAKIKSNPNLTEKLKTTNGIRNPESSVVSNEFYDIVQTAFCSEVHISLSVTLFCDLPTIILHSRTVRYVSHVYSIFEMCVHILMHSILRFSRTSSTLPVKRWHFTEESFEFDVSGNEIIEFHMTIFVTVSHHNCVERCVAHAVTCASIYTQHRVEQCNKHQS